MDDFNKPDIVLPLIAEFDQTGAFALADLSAGVGQRIVNAFPATTNRGGVQFPILQKRFGFTQTLALSASTQDDLSLICESPQSSDAVWVFQRNGGSRAVVSRGGAGFGPSAIVHANATSPRYIDRTYIGATQFAVLQTSDASASALSVFYGSEISSSAWLEISAANYLAISRTGKLEHLDGFAFQLGTDNKIYNSNLNSLALWNANDFIKKQIAQDNALGLARLGGIILAFGRETVECFHNAGNATGSPLGRIPNLSFDVGLEAQMLSRPSASDRHYYTTLNGVLYFLGNTPSVLATGGNNCGLYAFDGGKFTKVSTADIDSILSSNSTAVRPHHVCTVPVLGANTAIGIQLSTISSTSQKWMMYFPKENKWYEWNSSNVQPANAGGWFLRGGTAATVANLVSPFKGIVSTPSEFWDSTSGASYDFIFQGKLPKNSNSRASMVWAGVVADSISASASTTANGNANLYVSFSDDDYQTFSTPRVIDLTQRKKQIYRCGSYEDRAVRLVHSGNAECRIQAFIAKTM